MSNIQPESQQKESGRITPVFLRGIRYVFLFGAFYSFPGRKSSLDTRKVLYVLLILIIFIPHFCSFGYSVYRRVLQGKDALLMLAFGGIHGSTFVLSLISAKVLPEGLLDFEHLLGIYELKFKCQQTILKYYKHLRILTSAIVLSVVLYLSVLAMGMVSGAMSHVCASFPFCDFEEPLRTVVLVFNTLCSIVSCTHAFGVQINCILIARILKELFGEVANAFKSLDGDVDNKIESLVDQHQRVVELLNQINVCVRHYMLSDLFPNIPIILVILYGALSPGRSFEDKFMLSSLIPAAVVWIGSRIWFEAQVNVLAHKPLQYLWSLQYKVKTEKGQRVVSQFITRLTSDTIAYNIYGMMTVTMTTLLTLFGTLITYTIVVVQFQGPSPTVNLSHLLKNVSFCALNHTDMLA